MKHSLKAALVALLLTPVFSLAGSLQLNGVATFEQLRKEYYIGALYLAAPAHDASAVNSQGGSKRMTLHITAERWSPMQFAQHWNQMILINNGSATLNANVMDVLNFTSIPKGDLINGDELAVELTAAGTVVSLNGTTVVHTASANLFNMLINTWIGARPPSTEFKRDILNLPRDKAGTDLLARFEGIKPSDARRKQVASWGAKETETPATVATAVTPLATPATAAKPKVETPPPAPEAKKVAATSSPDKVAASPSPSSAPAAAPAPAPAPAIDTAAEKAKRARQQELYEDYSNQLRRLITRHITYPKNAVKRSVEGLVVVKVSVSHNGDVLSASIAQSADDMLDRAALQAIEKSGQLPELNVDLQGSSFDFMIPVVFKLTDG